MNRAVLNELSWPVAMAVGLGCVSLVSLGMSSALSAPTAYTGWFRSNGAYHFGLLLWDLMVVGGLGLGIPAFVAALAAFRLGSSAALNVLAFLAVALLSILLFLPWLHEGVRWGRAVSSMAKPWWRYGVELSLILGTLAARRAAR
jgi:hypothetical protein